MNCVGGLSCLNARNWGMMLSPESQSNWTSNYKIWYNIDEMKLEIRNINEGQVQMRNWNNTAVTYLNPRGKGWIWSFVIVITPGIYLRFHNTIEISKDVSFPHRRIEQMSSIFFYCFCLTKASIFIIQNRQDFRVILSDY